MFITKPKKREKRAVEGTFAVGCKNIFGGGFVCIGMMLVIASFGLNGSNDSIPALVCGFGAIACAVVGGILNSGETDPVVPEFLTMMAVVGGAIGAVRALWVLFGGQ